MRVRIVALAAIAATTVAWGDAPKTEWRQPNADNVIVMSLPQGDVVMELAPAFAPKTVANVKTLVAERYYDGLAIVRSQDNYVVQWADPNGDGDDAKSIGKATATVDAEFHRPRNGLDIVTIDSRDAYADHVGFVDGFPVAYDDRRAWLTHCYAMLGVARGMAADSGNGSSLYVITGHAPRHLDKNIALIGRVIAGIERLSSLPRGGGELGFYESDEEYTPVLRVRLASELDAYPTPEVMDTASDAFRDYVEGRTYRRSEWFFDPTGKIELCNLHPPVRQPDL